MKIRLTERKASDLKPTDRGYEVRDELVRGLILRVGKKGLKVWEVIVSRGGKRTRERLGTFPTVSVKEARIKADAAKEKALLHVVEENPRTVADIFEGYKTARSSEMRSWHDVQSVWDIWARDRLGHVRTTDVSIHHGLDLRKHVAQQSSPLRAAAVVRYLRPMFSWAADEQWIEANPWIGLKVGAKAQTRDRVLSDDEWTALWTAAQSRPYPFGPFIQLLMLSAQRLSNVAQIRWEEIRGDVWVIPREKMKATKRDSAKAHEVPLSKAMAELISKQPRKCDFIFSSIQDKPIWPGSKLLKSLQSETSTSGWRFHDIRRTATTIMTSGNETGKVSRFVAAKVLGHSDSTITATYDLSEYRHEKREALEVLASSIAPNPNRENALITFSNQQAREI
ncbi:tyrosine-type recombinase/integrase [Cognatishimia activa]|uniref:Tyrosine-type recombinase/integrase n=1 Tax=Cognatishimia activa TaxID=1715691 RepID=A0A975EMB7_9RHOB|nr:integrase family protein [Cognatishimia activa]QTN34679.1 tyrosine-type recombinase/integrase [Cognatishimia activa]